MRQGTSVCLFGMDSTPHADFDKSREVSVCPRGNAQSLIHSHSLTGDVVEGATKNREIRNPVFTVAQQSTGRKALDIYDLFDIHESIGTLVPNILILWLKVRVARWLAKSH